MHTVATLGWSVWFISSVTSRAFSRRFALIILQYQGVGCDARFGTQSRRVVGPVGAMGRAGVD